MYAGYILMIKIGSDVGWAWIRGIATGKVIEIHPYRHSILTKGKQIVRNGSATDPAVVIKQANGTLVIKLLHEVQDLRQENS